MSLKSSIQQTEKSIAERRVRLNVALNGVTESVGNRIIAPGTLVAAGLFGAALHRGRRLAGLRTLAWLQTANAGLRLLLTLSSRMRAATTTR